LRSPRAGGASSIPQRRGAIPESLGSQTAPQLSALAATTVPLFIEKRKMPIERGLACSADIGLLAPDNLAYKFSAMSSSPNDLFDRQSLVHRGEDQGISLLAS
jgi:hypothetical protein